MALILDGKALAKSIRAKIAETTSQIKESGKRAPCLAVVLVGDNPASQVYVKTKSKAAKECGFEVKDIKLSNDVSQTTVNNILEDLSQDNSTDAILLQLPLPKGLDSRQSILSINPNKDADGLHPYNQGKLMLGDSVIFPCTPAGVIKLIHLAYNEDLLKDPFNSTFTFSLAGKRAVIIGRSLLVGKPLGIMLLGLDATVTYVHSKTVNIDHIVKECDIVVAAVGKPKLVTEEWIKEGAVVVDVGINRAEEGKLVGDVDFNQVKNKALAITPVPGGVGPMTVAMLMYNTLQCYLKLHNK